MMRHREILMSFREYKTKNTAWVIIAGSVIVMLFLVFGTIWMGQNARKDTEAAVRSVSLLYLDELAGRREQVVAENLQDRISDMRTALELMSEEDLQDTEHRQAYQIKMKALFGLEKFAFVDTEGRIYTSTGTQDNIDEYHFDHLSINEAEISIKNLESRDKKVIIALPVNLISEGKRAYRGFHVDTGRRFHFLQYLYGYRYRVKQYRTWRACG